MYAALWVVCAALLGALAATLYHQWQLRRGLLGMYGRDASIVREQLRASRRLARARQAQIAEADARHQP